MNSNDTDNQNQKSPGQKDWDRQQQDRQSGQQGGSGNQQGGASGQQSGQQGQGAQGGRPSRTGQLDDNRDDMGNDINNPAQANDRNKSGRSDS